MKIAEQINLVVDARAKLEEALTLRHEAYQQWEEDNAFILDDETNARLACQEAETKLRELALLTYAETGDKTVAPGVGIRVMTKLGYDNQEAMIWAMEHKLALKLDTPAFEKIAKTNPLPFVLITDEIQATIATALAKI